MAGTWIIMQHDLPRKPEVKRITRATDAGSVALTVGRLFLVWTWADTHSEDGVIQAELVDIDDEADCTGFGQAMVDAGWLEVHDDMVVFPDFGDMNGQTAKTRAKAFIRQQRSRRASCHASVTVDRDNVTLDRDQTEQNKTIQNKEVKEKSAATASGFDWESDCPPSIKTPEAAAAFARWQAYRREAKLGKWKPVTIRAALAKFEPHGAPAFIAAIDKSISNGWRGLFEPDGGTTTTRKNDRNTHSQDAASKADLLARMKSTRQPTEARHAS
jgi:hypothetical protein